MKTTRKVLQILLPLVLLLTLLASCGGKEDIPWQKTTAKTSATTKSTPKETTTAQTTVNTTEATTAAPWPPSFNGEAFTIVSVGSRSNLNKLEFYFHNNEETELEKELNEAYLGLESKLDTVLWFAEMSYEDAIAALSGNHFVGDVMYARQMYWVPMATKGYIQPLNTEEIRSWGFDVDDPGTVDIYLTQATKELDGENVWAASFSGKYFVQYWTDGMVFNKDIVAAAGYPAETLYQLVRDGQWTWDKLEEICRAVKANTDKDGLGVASGVVEHIFYDMGITPARGADGKWKAPALEDVLRGADYALKWTGGAGEISFRLSGLSSSSILNEFSNKKIAFAFAAADYLYADTIVTFPTLDFNIGYLPGPKLDAEGSLIFENNIANGICIPTENPELRRTAYALGELAKIVNSTEGTREFVSKILPDEESVEMVMDYIIPNTAFASMSLSAPVSKVGSRFRSDIFGMHDDILGDLYDRDTAAQTYVSNLQAEIDALFGY
ncbi:MAG: extracellular solute-binding protein [Clostridia bacterium]|nr:extracellular solute-binding protein [Clostridia bacterium]